MREKSRTFSMRDGEAAAFLDNEAEVFALLRGLGDFAAFEAFGHQANGGDWGAQFVGHAGDEVALELVEAQLALEGVPGASTPTSAPNAEARHQSGHQQRVAPVRGKQQRRVGQVKLQDEARAAGQAFPVNLRAAPAASCSLIRAERPPLASATIGGAALVSPAPGPALRQNRAARPPARRQVRGRPAVSPANSPAPSPAPARPPI